jgi:hypothetical protein
MESIVVQAFNSPVKDLTFVVAMQKIQVANRTGRYKHSTPVTNAAVHPHYPSSVHQVL